MLKKILSSLAGILLMFLFGALLFTLQGYPAIDSYKALFEYSLSSYTAIKGTINIFVPLIFTGLSATLAFASGAVNLGQPGQFLMGAFFCTVVGTNINLHPVLMVPLLILASFLGGGLYAYIPAILRVKYKMNEFITSLMLNFIAEFFTLYMITGPMFDRSMQSPTSKAIHKSGWLINIGAIPSTIILAVIVYIIVAVYWYKTKNGYEMRMMGHNSLFSLLGGVKNKKNFTTIMFISGALAGLAGAILIMGPDMQHRFLKNLGTRYAWDGVMIAMISANSIYASLFYALLIAVFQTGSLGMELEYRVPVEMVLVLQSMLVIFVVSVNHIVNIMLPKINTIIKTRKLKE